MHELPKNLRLADLIDILQRYPDRYQNSKLVMYVGDKPLEIEDLELSKSHDGATELIFWFHNKE